MIHELDVNGAGVIRSTKARSIANTPHTNRVAVTYNCPYCGKYNADTFKRRPTFMKCTHCEATVLLPGKHDKPEDL